MSTSTSTTAPILLRAEALTAFAASVAAPSYDRSRLLPSIVHIGVGGFHRSHLATYIDELCRNGHSDWGIVGCGVLPYDEQMARVLDSQDHLYTLIERGTDTTKVQIIGSIVDYLHAHPTPEAAIAQIADPRTQIVSLTITEGGYPIDDRSGDYLADSRNAGPESAFGVLVAGLAARQQANSGPVTIMSCDNIMANGHVTQTATLGEAANHGPELVEWIKASASFPNSMVDRITPATTEDDRDWLRQTHGIDDKWPVVAEPFRQWVIEDDFAGERLPFEELDVIVTDNVAPYEIMKLRLLNAGHSCLAYLAALEGVAGVDQAMARDDIRGFVKAFLHTEAKPVLPHVAGVDVDTYIDSLIERFANPNIGDQISRLCIDGSAKLPKFILPTAHAQLAVDGPLDHSALAVAGWCEYLRSAASHGSDLIAASDPVLDVVTAYAVQSTDDPAHFLSYREVFGDLADSPRFVAAFTRAVGSLRDGGVSSAIGQLR